MFASLLFWLTVKLTDWLIDWLIDWLSDWLTVWLTNSLSDWQTDWLVTEHNWLTDLLAVLPSYLFDNLEESPGKRPATIEHFQSWARNDDNPDRITRACRIPTKSWFRRQQKRREGGGSTPTDSWIMSSTGILNSLRYRQVSRNIMIYQGATRFRYIEETSIITFVFPIGNENLSFEVCVYQEKWRGSPSHFFCVYSKCLHEVKNNCCLFERGFKVKNNGIFLLEYLFSF